MTNFGQQARPHAISIPAGMAFESELPQANGWRNNSDQIRRHQKTLSRHSCGQIKLQIDGIKVLITENGKPYQSCFSQNGNLALRECWLRDNRRHFDSGVAVYVLPISTDRALG